MILPGEFKLTSEYAADIIGVTDKVVILIQEALNICKNQTDVNLADYRMEELIGGLRLTGNTLYNSVNFSDNYLINLVANMAEKIKIQYGISFDQFLEEQYLEINQVLYEKMPIFAINNPTERFGDKYARWSDIDSNIDSINLSMHSNTRMTWSFIGATNTDI